jgi:hypothetical protein
MNFTDQKAIRTEIKSLSEEGKSKSEIFDLLKEKAAPKEAAWLAGQVASILPEEVKLKYKSYNVILSILYTLSFLVWIYYPYKDYGSVKYINYIITIVFVLSIVNSLYKYDIANLTGIIYVGIFMFLVVGIKAIGLMDPVYKWCVLLPAAAMFLSYKLRKILFPQADMFGRVKKDTNGNYIFND